MTPNAAIVLESIRLLLLWLVVIVEDGEEEGLLVKTGALVAAFPGRANFDGRPPGSVIGDVVDEVGDGCRSCVTEVSGKLGGGLWN